MIRLGGSPDAWTGLFRRPCASGLSLSASALVDLGVPMTLPDLGGWKPVVVVGIDIRCVDHERTGLPLDFIGIRAVICTRSLNGTNLGIADAFTNGSCNVRLAKEAIRPVSNDLVADVRRCAAIVVETLPPEAPEELRFFVEPVWLADVVVLELAVPVSRDLRNITIHREAAVSGPSSSITKEEDVGRCKERRGMKATLLESAAELLRMLESRCRCGCTHG
mmetsp:Transcript_3004/g.7144  ORF Transcript_3004/g.7144 Transcript_3004/m.7144 type:complete len:221 (-) Transcript_3004:40-702(-)